MWDGVQDVETQIHFPHNAAIILRTSVMSGDRQNLLRKEALFFWGGAELNCSSGLFSFSHLHRHFLNMFGGTLRWNIPVTFISACCRPSPNSPMISQWGSGSMVILIRNMKGHDSVKTLGFWGTFQTNPRDPTFPFQLLQDSWIRYDDMTLQRGAITTSFGSYFDNLLKT